MKNLNKKIIMSVLTLVLTIIALGTTTFAWFSLSTVSQVSNITGDVTVGDGLEIRLVYEEHNTPWKSNLSKTDVSTFIGEIFANRKLDAVTPTDGTFATFTKMKFEQRQQQLGHEALVNEDYIEFVVQFRSQKDGIIELTDLTFNLEEEYKRVFNGEKDIGKYIQIDGGDPNNLPVHTQAAYGARVSFDNKVFQYGEDSIEIVHIDGEDVVVGNTLMGATAIEAGQWSYLKDSQGLHVYDKDDNDEPISDPRSAAALTSLINEQEEAEVTVTLVAVPEEDNKFTASIKVRIWIEGWDADTYDAMFGSTLDISMEFAKQEED